MIWLGRQQTRSRTVCGVIILTLVQLAAGCVNHSGEPALAFTGATVIDGTGAAPRSGMTVVVEGGRIVAVASDGAVRVPAGARVIDGRGKYLIPGEWTLFRP